MVVQLVRGTNRRKYHLRTDLLNLKIVRKLIGVTAGTVAVVK